MQPFDPFIRSHRTGRARRNGAPLGYAESVGHPPRFGTVARDLGVVVLACLGLALLARLLVGA